MDPVTKESQYFNFFQVKLNQSGSTFIIIAQALMKSIHEIPEHGMN